MIQALTDNVGGSSNVNAKAATGLNFINTCKKTLSSTEDENFFEIARVVNGKIKTITRNTEYVVLEDTLGVEHLMNQVIMFYTILILMLENI